MQKSMQDIVVDYVTTMAHTAMDQAVGQGRKLLPEDFLYLVRKVNRTLKHDNQQMPHTWGSQYNVHAQLI
jgi:hypothetical protein